jgi:hypothetical protein
MWIWIVGMVAIAGQSTPVKIVVSGPNEVSVVSTLESVFVPACRGLTWMLFDADSAQFLPTAPKACGALAPAMKVGSQGLKFQVDVALPALPKVGFHLLRPRVVIGLKCKEKAPFPLAECGDIKVVYGPQIMVRNLGAATVSRPSNSK